MDELSFQTALAQYLTDSRFRDRLTRDKSTAEDVTRANQPTTASERLAALQHDRAGMFARLLIANRLSKAVRSLPWTTALLGDELNHIALDFNQASPPRNARMYSEACAFGRYLMSRFERMEPSLPYLPDVLRYELNSMELRFEFDNHYPPIATGPTWTTDQSKLHFGLELREIDTSVVPVALRNARVVSFFYDVEEIGKAVDAGKVPQDLCSAPITILFHVEPTGDLGQHIVSSETAAFLRRCDGRSTLAEVISGLAEELGEFTSDALDDFTGECAVLFASLVERRVLGYWQGDNVGV